VGPCVRAARTLDPRSTPGAIPGEVELRQKADRRDDAQHDRLRSREAAPEGSRQAIEQRRGHRYEHRIGIDSSRDEAEQGTSATPSPPTTQAHRARKRLAYEQELEQRRQPRHQHGQQPHQLDAIQQGAAGLQGIACSA
jgi:hypothetical protein